VFANWLNWLKHVVCFDVCIICEGDWFEKWLIFILVITLGYIVLFIYSVFELKAY